MTSARPLPQAPALTITAATHPDGTYCALQTVHDALWEHQPRVPNFLDILHAVGVSPEDTAPYATGTARVRLAGAYDRLYNWAALAQTASRRSDRATATGLGLADLPVLTGWAAVLTHPSITEVDGWRVHSAITPLIVPHRRTPHGWLYAAAGLTAKEAARADVDRARVMAALRGHILPAPSARNATPLVAAI